MDVSYDKLTKEELLYNLKLYSDMLTGMSREISIRRDEKVSADEVLSDYFKMAQSKARSKTGRTK